MRAALLILALSLAALGSGAAEDPLGKGDVFELRLSGMPLDYASEFRLLLTIRADGKIRVPLLGGFLADGRAPAALARQLAEKFLADTIFMHPTVALKLRREFVAVRGDVRIPQAIAWDQGMTLSGAITRAGGYTDWGGRRKARLERAGPTTLYILGKIDVDVFPGDVIEVLER